MEAQATVRATEALGGAAGAQAWRERVAALLAGSQTGVDNVHDARPRLGTARSPLRRGPKAAGAQVGGWRNFMEVAAAPRWRFPTATTASISHDC